MLIVSMTVSEHDVLLLSHSAFFSSQQLMNTAAVESLLFRHLSLIYNTHTHTHPFNGPLSRTTQVSQYQKGKTNLDFTEARDSEWQWHHHHSVFYRSNALPAAQPTASKH